MTTLFSSREWSSSPVAYWTIQYEYRRSGANMQYRFYWKVWLKNSGGWYYNALKLPIYLNGVNVETIQVKVYKAETGWTYEGTTGWYTVSNKTSGTVPVYFQLVDTGGTYQTGWSVKDTTGTYNLAVAPAASVLGTISAFTIGNAITIPITKYNSGFTDTLVIKYGNTTIKTISGITNGATVTFTTAELNTIYSLMSTVKSGTFSFALSTYSGSTLIGSSSATATGSLTNCNPTFASSNVSYQDTNEVTKQVTLNDQQIVQTLSTVAVTVTAATGNKGASISNYAITLNGVTKTLSSPGTVSFGNINSSSNITLTTIVTDSRGNTTTATKTVTFLQWSLPTGIVSVVRKNNFEDESYLKVNASYSNLDSKNTLTIQYQKKRKTEQTYSNLTTIPNQTEVTVDCDKNSAWDFRIILTDAFGTTTYNTVLAKGQFIFFVDTKKLSVGINCFPTKEESLEVNGRSVVESLYPIGSIYLSVNATNPSTLFGGTWERIQDRFLLAAGSSYAAGSTGGAATVSLATANLPSHTHSFSATTGSAGSHNHSGLYWSNGYPIALSTLNGSATGYTTGYSSGKVLASNMYTGSSGAHTHSVSGTTGGSGSGTAHNNMPPYLTVYMWKRIS